MIDPRPAVRERDRSMHAVSLTGTRYQCRRGDFAGDLADAIRHVVAHQFRERPDRAPFRPNSDPAEAA